MNQAVMAQARIDARAASSPLDGIDDAGSGDSDASMAGKKTHLHVASELTVSTIALERDRQRDAQFEQPAVALLAPPASRVPATQAQAVSALSKTLTKLSVSDPGTVARMALGGETVPMSVMAYAVGVVSLQSLSNTVRSVSKALEIQTDRQTKAVLQRLEDYREQLRKQQEEMEKARKSNIFTMAFDWVIGATEVVAGIVTLASGNVAGGTAEILAGVMGITKAALETAALVDEKDAKDLLEVANGIGIAQMVMETVSMLAGAGPYGVALRLALKSGMQAGSAVINLQRADAQKDASAAGVRMDSQQYLIDATEKSRKQTVEFLRDLYAKNASVVRGTSDMINSMMESQLRIARSLGGAAGRFA